MKWLVFLNVLGLFVSVSSFSYEAPENCDWQLIDNNEREVTLNCDVRTMNSDLVDSQLSDVHSETTVELNIKCSDVLFFQSSVQPRSFQKLYNLQTLSIDYCKLTSLPGGTFLELDRLRKLTVSTHNGDWSAMALELARETFIGMPSLQSLDIGQNNIWNLPERLFCPLPALRQLNLTSNRLQDISEIGAEGGCGAHLVSLDLSANDLVIIPDRGVVGLKALKQLYLQYNDISLLADRALSGLNQLQVLNMSSNRLAALPPHVFNESINLRELYLQNNTMSVLAPGLFESLTELSLLDLSSNHLNSDWISSETFEGLVRLIVLNVASNQLTTIHQDMFSDLSALQSLDLSHNQLNHINDHTFTKLANLHRLDLSFNHLAVLGGQSLAGLHVLSALDLANNNITQIEKGTFENCSSLRDINLNFNLLSKMPEAVSLLTPLRNVRLSRNLLTGIATSHLTKLQQLRHLDLSHNYIGGISKDSWLGLTQLETLDLSRNQITSLSHGIFDTNAELELLRLDGNKLSDINGLFASLPQLLWLNVSDNNIAWFDYALIPEKLLYLDLRNNEIKDLGNYFGVESRLKLRTLDVSHNKLESLRPTSVPNSIELLFVNSNLITKIEPGTFAEKTNLSMVDMFDNLLTKIELNSISLTPVPEDKDLPQFYIGGNPIFCDCKMEWMHRVHQISALRQHPRVMDLDKITCTLPYPRSDVNRIAFMESKPSQFVCPYTSHCFALCQCCDYIACDCQMTCPSGCSCYHDDTWATNIVDCSARGHNQLPDDVPMDATIVYMDANHIPTLDAHHLIGRKNLRSMYLNNSNIERIQNRTFHGLSSLKVLHLQDNMILELEGFEFEHLEHLRELHLQNNRLTTINNATFVGLRSLEVLRLDSNFLVDFPVWQFKLNKGLGQLHLQSNPWTCDCYYMVNFKSWLESYQALVADAKQITCTTNSSRNAGPFVLETSYSCENFIATSIVQQKNGAFYLTPVLIAFSVLFVCLVIGILFAVFRVRLKKSVGQKCGLKWVPPTSTAHDNNDKNILYDLFVAYSELDAPFVNEALAPELENGEPGYKVCLASRDYETTGNYVGDFIINSVEASRQVILVLTSNFVNDWCKYSFKATHLAALKCISNKMIVVTCDDVNESSLDPDLAALIQSAKKINYNDKNFWNKLRPLLPHGTKKVNHPCFISETNYMIRNNINTMSQSHPAKKGQLIPNMVLNGGIKSPPPPHASHHSNLAFDHAPNLVHHHHLQQLGPATFLHQQHPTHHHHHPNPLHSANSEAGDMDRTFLSTDTAQSSLNHSYMSVDYIASRNSHIYASIEDAPNYPGHLVLPTSTAAGLQSTPLHCQSIAPNPLVHQHTRPYALNCARPQDANMMSPSYFI